MGSRRERRKNQNVPHDEDQEGISSLAARLAIFGDSNVALLASLLMLLVAVFVAVALDPGDTPTVPPSPRDLPFGSRQSRQAPVNANAATIHSYNEANPLLVTPQIMDEYKRDGVIAVRGLLEDLLDQIDTASSSILKVKNGKKGGTQFFQVEVGVALENEAFRNVALSSKVSSFAATLLQLTDDSTSSTMRLLRDIFLVKDDDQYICGWHTDDTGFWPATAAAPGVNAWIALDDMPIEGGGGFALAVGSHTVSWRMEAHKVTGSTQTLPAEGFRDVADMFANRTGSGTCNIKTSAPHLHAHMEESMRVYEIKRGDVIFHDRWLFHRTVPFDEQYARQMEDQLYRRYSVRYGPGSSIVPPGYGLELSALWDEGNAGRSADDISKRDGPWYPRCWPSVDEREMEELPVLMRDKMPVAKAARKAKQQEMKPYLQEMRQKHA